MYSKVESGLLLPTSVAIKKKPDQDPMQLRVRGVNGLIRIYRPNKDGSDEELTVTTVEEAQLRYEVLIENYKRYEQLSEDYPAAKDFIPGICYMIAQFKEAITQAQEQGPPSSASMRRERVRRMPKNFAITTSMPS